MKWYSDINAHNKLKSKIEISRTRCLRRSIFEHNRKNKFFERFISTANKLGLLSILIVMVFLLLYCYNSKSKAVDYRSIKDNDNNVPFKKTERDNTTTLLSVQSTAEKSLEVPEIESISQNSTVTQMKSTRNVTSRYAPVLYPTANVNCRMFSCFNYTRCPLTGGFPIYLYDPFILYNDSENVTALIKEIFGANPYITSNATEACIFLVITEFSTKNYSKSKNGFKLVNETFLNTLPYWGRDGRNHVLLNLGQSMLATGTGSATIAQSMFTHRQFRPGFDVVIPQAHTPVKTGPLISPAKRKHLLSFQGPRKSIMGRNPEREALVYYLQEVEWSEIHNLRFHFHCKNVETLSEHNIDDWALCGNRKSRRGRLLISTFSLIIAPGSYAYASTNVLQTRLYEALETGAIPVILGGDRIRLPYEEVLDWRKAVLRIPMARATELRFLLQNVASEDIIAFRKHGRMLLERYLGSVQAIVDTLLAVIRTRLNIPPQSASKMLAIAGTKKISAFNARKKKQTAYKRNFTVGLLNGYELWNSWGDPFTLYPELPWDPILPPDARYLNPSVSAQYDNTCSTLAGDWPMEKFTIVILTNSSNRNATSMLNVDILRLSKLRFLHKIVVVCNGPRPSTKGWPTKVPIALVRAPHNSLSNRFMPYDLIETEAVFSLDDNIVPPLSKEIVFAFKVWREHRDQIVGFYGGNFVWNTEEQSGFLYNERDQNCEVSIMQTGAAFIHRYYLWAYWRQLPVSVQEFVDKHNNCEDIAMNFLVAQITRKPPIKVTSTWSASMTKRASSIYKRLSPNSSHFEDRHQCLNFFTKAMGYNPLLNTHFCVSSFKSILRGSVSSSHSTKSHSPPTAATTQAPSKKSKSSANSKIRQQVSKDDTKYYDTGFNK